MVPDVSPSGSFRGWLFSVWFVKNKGFVKLVLSGYVTFISTISIGGGRDILVEVGGATIMAGLLLGSKIALDSIDFFFSDVDLP